MFFDTCAQKHHLEHLIHFKYVPQIWINGVWRQGIPLDSLVGMNAYPLSNQQQNLLVPFPI